jgi:putative flippase GtrA
MNTLPQRFGRFASVGVLGFAVQLALLQALAATGLGYVVATALAVELTILHNFVWHESYTWGDDGSVGDRRRALRLVRFNASTAFVSVGGNVVLTWLFIESLHLPLIVANALAVCALAALNYVVADRWVFGTDLRRGDQKTRSAS